MPRSLGLLCALLLLLPACDEEANLVDVDGNTTTARVAARVIQP